MRKQRLCAVLYDAASLCQTDISVAVVRPDYACSDDRLDGQRSTARIQM